MTDKEIIRKLSELYPDGAIIKLKVDHKKLYNLCFKDAKTKRLEMEEYFSSLGFEYKKEGRYTTNYIQSYLLRHYPDRIIVNFFRDHFNLYRAVIRKAEKEKLNLEQYLQKLGFTYKKNRIPIKDSEIKDRLLKYYPNRVVNKLQAQDNALYARIMYAANKKGITVKQYIFNLGFKTGLIDN